MSNNSNGSRNKSESSPVDDGGIPIHQVIQMGEAASQLLNNPIYNMAHRMAVNEAVDQWSQTSPKEHAKRESLWHEVQALGRVAESLAGLVARAQELAQRQSEEQHMDEQEYLDRQGFGFSDEQAGARRFQ